MGFEGATSCRTLNYGAFDGA